MTSPWVQLIAQLILEHLPPSVPKQRAAEVKAHAKADPIRSVPINQAEWIAEVAVRIAREEAAVWNDWPAVCAALDAWTGETR